MSNNKNNDIISEVLNSAPYQNKTVTDPSLLEVPMVKADFPAYETDSYSDIEEQFDNKNLPLSQLSSQFIKNDYCSISKSEKCLGCKTCIRLGF